MAEIQIKLNTGGNGPVEFCPKNNTLINTINEKRLREISSLTIMENLIESTDISILIDSDGGMLSFIDYLDKQLPGRFYNSLYTPFENDYLPLGFNEQYDFLSIYKKSIVYEILYYIISEGIYSIRKDEAFGIFESITNLYNLSDVSGILGKLYNNKTMKEFMTHNQDRISLIQRSFSKRTTLYDIMEDSFSQKDIYPFMLFSLKEGFQTGFFINTLICCMSVLFQRRWIDKGLKVNLVLNIKYNEKINGQIRSFMKKHDNVLLFIIDPELSHSESEEKQFTSINSESQRKDPNSVKIINNGESYDVYIEAPSYYSNYEFSQDRIKEYYMKKKKIKKTSSFVQYKSEAKAINKNQKAGKRTSPVENSTHVYYMGLPENTGVKEMYPYLGSLVICEYKKNFANLNLIKRHNLLFRYFAGSNSFKIDYFDKLKMDNLVETVSSDIFLKPVNIDLNRTSVKNEIKKEIKDFVIKNESINLFYNKPFEIFSEYKQSYTDFLGIVKSKILSKYDKDLWTLKQAYLEKWKHQKDVILQDYPDISAKDLIENHYLRHFLFNKDVEYPESLALSSLADNIIENSKLRYSVKRFEEELLERLLILKDKMDRLIEKTISYPVKPDLENIYIEELNIVYLPFSYENDGK